MIIVTTESTVATTVTEPLKRLSDEGVSIWLDDLSRERVTSGNLAKLIEKRHVVGVTTNPSIFQAAIGSGEGYEDQLADLAVRGVTVDEAVRMMTTADVRAAADVLRPVYDATGAGTAGSPSRSTPGWPTTPRRPSPRPSSSPGSSTAPT